MEKEYQEMVKSFDALDVEEQEKIIAKHLLELLNLMSTVNRGYNVNNSSLPIYRSGIDESDYNVQIFSTIMSLKEECAKLIEKAYYE